MGLLPSLRAGKPLASLPAWPNEKATPAKPDEAEAAVALTVGAIGKKLAERRDRIQSLSVTYEVISEARAEPSRLLAWNLHHVRDYPETALRGVRRVEATSRSRGAS